MFDADCRAGLADEQLRAVDHGDGPLVIVAGAGTGKTRTLDQSGRCTARARGARRSGCCC